MSKTLVSILLLILLFIASYGYYEKQRRAQLIIDFKNNKPVLCDKEIIQIEKKWMIHNNRFFTNRIKFYTIIYCKSVDKFIIP